MNKLTEVDRRAVQSVLAEMSEAWKAGDSNRFAATFKADAVQVNIFGAQLIGRQQIQERHDRVFRTVFQRSNNALQLIDARYLAPTVILARVLSSVDVPQGPLQGTLVTVASLLLERADERWELTLFHNTRVMEG